MSVPVPPTGEAGIVEVSVTDELSDSFMEYALSVIVSRAIPDVRDGLKPVQRRILYAMYQAGMLPDKPHRKSASTVGDTMGKYHPHGDAAIYDALVRLAQPWSRMVPLVDGHGNFGSLDDGPAAARYTEARLSDAGLVLLEDVEKDTVAMGDTFDGSTKEPLVLPAGFPTILVNGAAGIAVGVATNMPPHNLGEVILACQTLLKKPGTTSKELFRVVPGPDFPTGGALWGDNIEEVYATGRGILKMRGTVDVIRTGKRYALKVTELPYGVGPEKLVSRIKTLTDNGRLEGVAQVQDLTDRHNGLQLLITLKTGSNPTAVQNMLFQETPLEETFAINNVVLVDGTPKTCSFIELCQHYIDHRLEVVLRRSKWLRNKAAERAHLLEGFLAALNNIDVVVGIIKSSKTIRAARSALTTKLKVTPRQADHILEMPLRRLTTLEHNKLVKELETLAKDIVRLTQIVEQPSVLRKTVSDELGQVAARFSRPRRTRILDQTEVVSSQTVPTPSPRPDSPDNVAASLVGLRFDGKLVRFIESGRSGRNRTPIGVSHLIDVGRDLLVGVITSNGRLVRVPVDQIDQVYSGTVTRKLGATSGTVPTDLMFLADNEHLVGVVSLSDTNSCFGVVTSRGLVKRFLRSSLRDEHEQHVITLKKNDRIVFGGVVADNHDFCVVSTTGNAARFEAADVRPQGLAAGGVAAIKLGFDAQVAGAGVFHSNATPTDGVTLAAQTNLLGVKLLNVTQLPVYRRGATGVKIGVFRKGETFLDNVWVGPNPHIFDAATNKVFPTVERDLFQKPRTTSFVTHNYHVRFGYSLV
ncbi:MAG: DNA topoisomerase (ATP-hydrolyzing) [Acidimicrobiia bacterium]